MATINGTNVGDDLFGTPDNDTINAAGGNDLILGSAGSDLIDGGDGTSDVVLYSNLEGAVFINNTDRRIGTVAAYSVVKDEGGTDTLINVEAFHGTQFGDTIHVGDNTYVFGEGGNDRIYAGTNVAILPGSGNDTIYGGGVTLDYTGGDGSAEQINGITAVWNSATSGVVFNDGWGYTDYFYGATGISGTDYADFIVGNIGDEFLDGNAGNDALYGHGGNDYITSDDGDDFLSGGGGDDNLVAGEGNDTLHGGSGYNELNGGAGNDVYFVDSSVEAVNYIFDVEGDADVLQVLDTSERDAFRLVYNGENLVHETFNGHRTIVETDDNGTPVIEYLQWRGSEDYGTPNYENALRIVTDLTAITGRLIAVAATDEDDTIVLPNEDVLDGEYWGEVYANNGNDIIYLSDTFKYITYAGGGNDSVYGGATSDHVTGDDGDDLLVGNDGDDTLDGGAGQDEIQGGKGNDVITGGGAWLEADGILGEDLLFGGDGDDTIDASGSDGYIMGGAGNDVIIGGAGYDQISYEDAWGGVFVHLKTGIANDGMGGTDSLSGIEMLRGSYFADLLVGDDQDNNFRGLDGDDTIIGGAGSDRVNYSRDERRGATQGVIVNLSTEKATDGWGSTDTLLSIENVRGTIFNDMITGNQENNDLDGQEGNDTLYGEAGDDDLFGGEGDDRLFGGDGDDWMRFEEGNDTFDGGEGFDRADYRDATSAIHASLVTGQVKFDNGDVDLLINVERVTGSAFDDTLLGNDGETNSFSGEAGNDFIDGGNGFDYVWYGRAEGAIYVDLEANLATGGEGDDTLYSIEGIGGSNYSDTLLGDDNDNYFDPDWEGDQYTPNNDVGGFDHIDGRGGFDTVSYRRAVSGIVADLSIGRAIDGLGNFDTLISIEAIKGSIHSDSIRGGSANESLSGEEGDDTIHGGSGDDLLFGGNGDDSIFGGAGNDTIDDGPGNDLIDGGSGIDTFTRFYNITTEENVVLGIDLVLGETFSPNFPDSPPDRFVDIENLIVSGRADFILIGDAVNNRLQTSGGNDTLDGGGGTDTLIGGFGDDVYITDGGDTIVELAGGGNDTVRSSATHTLGPNVENLELTGVSPINGTGNTLSNTIIGNSAANRLDGGAGNDSLIGGSGNDFLTGGIGKDHLTGNDGVDQFVFRSVSESSASATSADVITDFVRGIDKINLSAIDAFHGGGKSNDTFLWRGISAFNSTTAGEVRYQKYDNPGAENDYTMVFIDNDRDSQVEMSIRVNGLHNFTSSDFIL